MVQTEILQQARDYCDNNKKVMFSASEIGFEDIDMVDAIKEGFLEPVDLGNITKYVFTATALPQVKYGNLFEDIYGYKEAKELFYRVLAAERNNGILMLGPPASAKSLFLKDIAKLPNSKYVMMTHITKKGLNEILLNEKPDFLILDELDKAKPADYDTLHGLFEDGIVQKHVSGDHQDIRVNVKVFAAANSMNMPQSILSRFLKLKFKPYVRSELANIGIHMLMHEGRSKEEAELIADNMMDLVRDPRDFIKYSDMLFEVTVAEIERVKMLMKKYQ